MKTLLFVMGLGVSTAAMAPRALASGRPACGNTMGKGRRTRTCEVTTTQIAETAAAITHGIVTTVYVPPPPAPDPVELARDAVESDLANLAWIEPRKLGNGRPACGNTGGKSMGDEHACTVLELAGIEHAKRALQAQLVADEAKLVAAAMTHIAPAPIATVMVAAATTERR